MDATKQHKRCHRPDIGRGCCFCDCRAEVEATPVEGCYKLHEAQWTEGYPDNLPTDIFEVRFKNTRRSYYQNVYGLDLKRGDIVAVEASPGHDIGVVSLTGDLVAKQMRRVGFNPYNGEFKKIYRKAKPYDIERWQEAIALEHETMIASRQIAADMGLNMKIGDVEYQGDKIKAIFYYIADERVDFRELIKVFAERFHIRIEMKQIGARQEAGRIGGLGACGRELCCASWISGFTSVTTNAARVQELSLNPQKLAGQCSKLKCCLMYEYDTYSDARRSFPRVKELQALDGDYYFIKNDILAGTMTFSSSKDALSNLITLPVERVREILALNRAGKKVDRLQSDEIVETVEEPTYRSEEDSITRFDAKRRGKRNRKGGSGRNDANRGGNRVRANGGAASEAPKSENPAAPAQPAGEQKPAPANGDRSRNRRNERQNRERNGQNRERNEQRNEPRSERPNEQPAGPSNGQQASPASGTENPGGAPRRDNRHHAGNNRNRRPNNGERRPDNRQHGENGGHRPESGAGGGEKKE